MHINGKGSVWFYKNGTWKFPQATAAAEISTKQTSTPGSLQSLLLFVDGSISIRLPNYLSVHSM